MPDYLLNRATWEDLWPLFAVPLLSSLLICFALGKKPYLQPLGVVFALSLIGVVTGQITGLSRVAAVGTVMPAVLGLLGGVMLYLIGTKGERLQATVVMAVIGLTSNLLIGVYWGATSRALSETEALAKRSVAEENARYAAAVQKLLNDRDYDKLKSDFKARDAK
jgi:hypothetical protein